MCMGMAAKALSITNRERSELKTLSQAHSTPRQWALRARIVLLAANPRLINFYLAVQRLPSPIHHGPAELVKHHPGGLVARQTELSLYQQRRHTALIGGHQIRGPEPVGQ